MFFRRLALFATVASALVVATQANAAPVIVGTYWDESASGMCSASLCPVFFSQLPPNKRLMVREINCNILTASQPRRAILQISTVANGADTLARVLPIPIPYVPPVAGGFYYTSANLQTRWLIGEGRFPYLLVEQNQSGTAGVTCTMIGDLVDPA
ncbi:hypothetical protein JQ628_06370 [Bradyrhizobium lablabi]|uniref:hypothetical protein n=1 Tax=Bradyrhizobium lablabi TaxID=722472 RepID=UPI001BA82DEC|nr:hypothetical protein [Bradyrhizobium lablabi]MBR1121131.1 hypothetical protein [Bradyrhizobium lablabi]